MADLMLGAALLALGAYTAIEVARPPAKTYKPQRYSPYHAAPKAVHVPASLTDMEEATVPPSGKVSPALLKPSDEQPCAIDILSEDEDGPAFVGVDPAVYLEARD